jgi:peptidoglycan/LPS O-acetylase OafA/YrhL
MRLATLDGIRGIAAFTVVLSHCYATYSERLRFDVRFFDWPAWMQPWPWLRFTPLHLLVSGVPAVMVFFVLSGFVLTLPFIDRHPPGFPSYLIKRVCRIYLPFIAAILFSVILFCIVDPHSIPALSNEFNNESWSHPLTLHGIFGHLMMTGMKDEEMLDIPMWSLVHELRLSLIFPFLIALVRIEAGWAVVSAIALHVLSTFALFHVGEDSLPGTLFATGQFVVCFVVGIALALHVPIWSRTLRNLPSFGRLFLWIASFSALLCPATAFGMGRSAWIAGAAGLITLCLSSPTAERLLSKQIPQWLGQVSYSLYLFHMPVLLTAVHALRDTVPQWAILSGVIAVSLCVAQLMFLYVERPSMRLSRRLAGRLAKGGVTVALSA